MHWHHVNGADRGSRRTSAYGAQLRRRCAAFKQSVDTARPVGVRAPRQARTRASDDRPALLLLGTPRLRHLGGVTDLPLARWVALLAYLARGGGWVRREVLAALFWPEHDDHGASLNLRQTLQTIVRSAAGVALEREPTRVRWTGSSDVEAFDALVRDQAWAAAVSTYGGVFLDGLNVPDVPNVQEWIDAERSGLHARWRTGALAMGRSYLNDGRCFDLLALAERLCRSDPFDEEALRLMLRAAVGCGDRKRAERTLATACSLFQRELGVAPEADTLALAGELGLGGPRG